MVVASASTMVVSTSSMVVSAVEEAVGWWSASKIKKPKEAVRLILFF